MGGILVFLVNPVDLCVRHANLSHGVNLRIFYISHLRCLINTSIGLVILQACLTVRKRNHLYPFFNLQRNKSIRQWFSNLHVSWSLHNAKIALKSQLPRSFKNMVKSKNTRFYGVDQADAHFVK